MNKKLIILTGISGGIGSGIINKLCDTYNFIGLVRETSNQNQNIKNYVVNFNSWKSIEEVIQQISLDFGHIDGFVHAAGNDILAPLSLINEKMFDDLFAIHAYFPIKFLSISLKRKLFNNSSSVILFSSLAAHKPSPGHSLYASAKGAIEGFLPTASNELLRRGIRLNLISPGIVETKMSKQYLDKLTEDQFNQLKSSYPLGFIQTNDVVLLVDFLLSDKSSKITGQNYFIDGGNLIHT